jgi:CubicO group peptidase (beta-lactamase class C family)
MPNSLVWKRLDGEDAEPMYAMADKPPGAATVLCTYLDAGTVVADQQGNVGRADGDAFTAKSRPRQIASAAAP